MNINSDKPLFYPYSILVNKCSGSCSNINNTYAKLCVPDIVKNMNIKVFNLVSIFNETGHMSWHETCICKCRSDASVCNDVNVRIMIKVELNVKNWLIKEGVIKNFLRILLIINVWIDG